ncbi:MAG: hypothetical protein SV375_05200 [Thermodesulfobacteriota bacterium]|nr:hypothetical protein [Thermodesulfobacteriota bacterium]
MYLLSKHFLERWAERVGGPAPTVEDINELIEQSALVQRYRITFTPRGRRLVVMALYWNSEWDVVLKIDENSKKVVTVIAGQNGTQIDADKHR